MTTLMEQTSQLSNELKTCLERLSPLIGDVAETETIPRFAHEVVHRLAAPSKASRTAVQVMAALWPHGYPETVGRPEWWRSPLGVAVGKALPYDHDEAVTHQTASEMLDLHRGTIRNLIDADQLERHHETRGVIRSSVINRIVTLHATRQHSGK